MAMAMGEQEPSHTLGDQLKVVDESTDKSEDLDAENSSYWYLRESNIQANKNFLATLKMDEDKVQRKKRPWTKRPAPKNRRQSLRQRHVEPENNTFVENGTTYIKLPKRPISAYLYFLTDCHKEATKTGKPPTNIAVFSKQCSEKWRALTPQQTEAFDSAAAKDKKRYDEDMAGYKGKRVHLNKPKRPPISYFLFLEESRIIIKDKGVGEKKASQIICQGVEEYGPR